MYEELIKALETKNTAEAQRLITEMDISEVIANNNTILELTFHNGLYSVYEIFIDKLINVAINEINDKDVKAIFVSMAKYSKNLVCEIADNQDIIDDTDVLGDNSSDDSSFE